MNNVAYATLDSKYLPNSQIKDDLNSEVEYNFISAVKAIFTSYPLISSFQWDQTSNNNTINYDTIKLFGTLISEETSLNAVEAIKDMLWRMHYDDLQFWFGKDVVVACTNTGVFVHNLNENGTNFNEVIKWQDERPSRPHRE